MLRKPRKPEFGGTRYMGATCAYSGWTLWITLVKLRRASQHVYVSRTIASTMKEVVPDKAQLKKYLAAGLTQKQIVEQYEKDTGIKVSRSAIGMAISRYGLR